MSLPTSTKDLSTDSQTLHNHCLKLLVATVSGCELLPNKMLNREKEYEVEKILNRRDIRGKLKYLVRYKGYMAE